MLTQSAAEARYIVIYTSCGANSTFDETFRTAATAIPVLFHSAFGPTTAEAEKGLSLADLLPPGPVSPRQFGDICAQLTGTRVLIILDEFDRCESGAFRGDVAEIIKNLSDRQGRVPTHPRGCRGRPYPVGRAYPLDPAQHLRPARPENDQRRSPGDRGQRRARRGLHLRSQRRDEIVSVAHGSPYIANLICHHAGHAALDEGRSTVLSSDVANALARAVAEFQGRIGKAAQNQIRKLVDQGLGEVMAVVGALGPVGRWRLQRVRPQDHGRCRRPQGAALPGSALRRRAAQCRRDDTRQALHLHGRRPSHLPVDLWARRRAKPRRSRRGPPLAPSEFDPTSGDTSRGRPKRRWTADASG